MFSRVNSGMLNRNKYIHNQATYCLNSLSQNWILPSNSKFGLVIKERKTLRCSCPKTDGFTVQDAGEEIPPLVNRLANSRNLYMKVMIGTYNRYRNFNTSLNVGPGPRFCCIFTLQSSALLFCNKHIWTGAFFLQNTK
jgi:hypothetical protein